MLDPRAMRTAVRPVPYTDPHPPARTFVDPDGVEWLVEYCGPEEVHQRFPRESMPRAGLVFSSRAMLFHQPMHRRVDPRVLTASQLGTMVEHAYD